MKIAVNTRFLLEGNLEGIGKFTHHTLQEMVDQHPDDEFYFIFDRPYPSKYIYAKNVTPIVVGPQARHPWLWKIWFDLRLPRILKKINPDVFLSPDGYTSLPYKGKKVTVIHDLAFEHYPRFIPSGVARYYRKYTPRFIKASDRVVTVSEFVKQDVMEHYQCSEKKIDVVYNASDYTNSNENQEASSHLEHIEAFLDGSRYFLYIGAVHPRKNVLNMLKAFELFRQKNFREIKFIIAGRDAWGNHELHRTLNNMSAKSDVLLTGPVHESVKRALLKGAEGLIYCSYFEGFGIPVVEAQVLGCPVITSESSALPEVAGEEAALFSKPSDPYSIAEMMGRLVNEPGLKDKLIANGKENVRRFSWKASAEKMYKILKTVAEA